MTNQHPKKKRLPGPDSNQQSSGLTSALRSHSSHSFTQLSSQLKGGRSRKSHHVMTPWRE